MSINSGPLSLADIADLSEDVPVGNGTVKVKGISLADALEIVTRFPKLAAMAGGFKLADVISVAPGAVAAILATATGAHGDSEAEAIASRIPIEIQMDLLEAVGKLTFKSGFGPFADRLLAMAGKQPIKATSTTSPPASKPLSPTDIPSEMSGDLHPGE